MTKGVATGTFEVTLKSLGEPGAPIGTVSIAKVFHGDLAGTSAGQMLSFRTTQEGSAGYVAMEQVVATLAGRHGGFVLQHSGTMERGAPTATISVVPDSGTQDLLGVAGHMVIRMQSAQHHYTFDYTLPD